MYQGNTEIVLDKCEMLDEEHSGKKKQKNKKRQLVTLSDELNKEPTQRWCPRETNVPKHNVKWTMKILESKLRKQIQPP